ncbi:hypothetical protein KUH03_15955 [Sphingobacterium sp. E70]|uniref:hypothetical protein n=1 Tax=Sphingobacterium sp. E70 TaxID=2853439 RepID=UPI00211B7A95|nr:hypothetical protein [Sphingobacterium sp. E70]ULT27966.1 hypothetical protein KUH03_15955 [Sphingobacterium sp. E70]
MKKLLCIIAVIVLCSFTSQKSRISPKGTLFVIGGGHKDEHLMEALVEAAQLSPKDYIMILPMASTVPDESVEGMVNQLREVTKIRSPVLIFRNRMLMIRSLLIRYAMQN